MCFVIMDVFVIMELFTNLSPNGTIEHFPISRESKNNTYVVYYIFYFTHIY